MLTLGALFMMLPLGSTGCLGSKFGAWLSQNYSILILDCHFEFVWNFCMELAVSSLKQLTSQPQIRCSWPLSGHSRMEAHIFSMHIFSGSRKNQRLFCVQLGRHFHNQAYGRMVLFSKSLSFHIKWTCVLSWPSCGGPI